MTSLCRCHSLIVIAWRASRCKRLCGARVAPLLCLSACLSLCLCVCVSVSVFVCLFLSSLASLSFCSGSQGASNLRDVMRFGLPYPPIFPVHLVLRLLLSEIKGRLLFDSAVTSDAWRHLFDTAMTFHVMRPFHSMSWLCCLTSWRCFWHHWIIEKKLKEERRLRLVWSHRTRLTLFFCAVDNIFIVFIHLNIFDYTTTTNSTITLQYELLVLGLYTLLLTINAMHCVGLHGVEITLNLHYVR